MKGLTTEEFIAKAKERHGDEYDYSNAIYKNYLTSVTVICREHGAFSQKPNNHLHGAKCPTCSMKVKIGKLSDDKGVFVKKAQDKFGDRYSYDRVEYVNAKTPVILTCKKHGHFKATPNSFLTGHSECSACSGSKLTTEAFVARAKLVHGERYDYSNSLVAGYHGIVTVTCREHGDFEQTPNNHLQGKGCPKCIGKMVSDTESFIVAANIIHGEKYGYSHVEYVSSVKKVKIECAKHGIFLQTPSNHTTGNGCPKCSPKVSKPEIELFDFVSSLCPDAEQSSRSVIPPQELDIVVPGKKIAIEFNGLYYHSDRNEGKRDDYHHAKMIATGNAGYRLIQVWEDDWRNNRPVVEKTLKHILGASDEKTPARKCKIATPQLKDTVQFFIDNHLQGCSRQGVVYSLESCGKTVAAMVFHPIASERGKAADAQRWELGRYATAHAVVGGASRLFNAFLKDHPECVEIISYSDNDWFTGGMYEALGFTHASDVAPDYKVVDSGLRRHKTNYKLSELEKRFGDKFDPLLTERENCRNNGLYRVYNSGLKKWRWVSA